MKQTSIKLSTLELQQNYNRVAQAEGLIKQLPETHDGRNTWLMNYGAGDEAEQIRARNRVRTGRPLVWCRETDCLESV